jgi:hypothetical protein
MSHVTWRAWSSTGWRRLHERDINKSALLQRKHKEVPLAVSKSTVFLVSLLLLVDPVAAQRQALGIFGQWGSFADARPRRCYAIAQPTRSLKADGWQPFASVSFWPGRQAREQVHFRLSRQKRQGSAILLRIDDRTFQLVGGGRDAWAPGPVADREIAAAMRTGVHMSVDTRSVRGGRVRDHYQLRGAATAIDAAAIACLSGRGH